MTEQKIKQDAIRIGENIRRVRKLRGMGQTELANRLQLEGIDMTRETLVKIERGIQHISASQLRGIRDVLGTSYEELLKETP
ncbi:helix-turn-helix domain-containing protein [Pseudoflavonifractor phocaeensis]|uniref:helix-turn-helix domain-containing protein n=1 Tax=Pseudoflavonifractor phocaeensis TaxID=1870988 RepID=UPI001956057F|nr:helix-turn-helix transcriptional regulator [Pseudoflavonifractor phocaeensis]MBM6926400.1 helix-turn-helix transcriptional regulator [Pseudoflavonifractor phocaeensis]